MLAQGEVLEKKYRIVRLIGEGGMGAVFEGEAIRLHRRVAIKVLRSDSAGEGEMATRFQLEAQAAGRIGSRHIVEVIDLGQLPSGAHYMVMEYLDGQSLRDRIAARGGMSPAEIYPIAEQLIAGVSAAHAAGVIHRDLKPDNVYLVRQTDGRDFVKILDFGISKFKNAETGPDSRGLSLTRTGALMGTPYYLSPEQASGSKSIDHRTDLYTVGVILYECLTGVVPYTADTFNELLFRIVLEPPMPVYQRVPEADPNFVALIERAMAKDPKLRFQSAEEMKLALAAFGRGEPLSEVLGADASARRAALRQPISDGTLAASMSGAVRIDTGRGAKRHDATVASAGDGPIPNRTVEPWSQSGRSSNFGIGDEFAPRRSKLPWIVGGLGLLAVVGISLALLGGGDDKAAAAATGAPSASHVPVVAKSVAAPVVPPPPRPVIEPLNSPSMPAVAPDPYDAPRNSDPTALRAPAARPAARVTVRPRAAAAAPAAVPAAEPPAAAKPAAPPPATETDVSRIRGGRAIRSDL